jgi:hypothetical protein
MGRPDSGRGSGGGRRDGRPPGGLLRRDQHAAIGAAAATRARDVSRPRPADEAAAEATRPTDEDQAPGTAGTSPVSS